MPVGPLNTQVYIDEILSNVSVAYSNPSYIADQIFPEVQVKHRTGQYFVYDKSKLRIESDLRAPGQRANQIHWGLTPAAYGPLLEHSFEAFIPDEDREEAVDPINLDSDTTEQLTELVLLSKENDAKTIMTTAATGYLNSASGYAALTGTSKWSDYANSDPIGDIQSKMDVVKKSILKKPNTLVLAYPVYSMLRNHPQILERIKYSQLGVVTPELMAKVFDIERILIAEAEYNSANEGATDSLDYLWGKDAWLAFVTAKPGIKQVSYAYTLRRGARVIKRWRDDSIDTDFFRVKDVYQHYVMAIEACFRFVGAIA